jgi:hypothetical protein
MSRRNTRVRISTISTSLKPIDSYRSGTKGVVEVVCILYEQYVNSLCIVSFLALPSRDTYQIERVSKRRTIS